MPIVRLNSGQRVIVCVGLGALLVVLGFAARAWWWETPSGGWFNYAPNNGVVFSYDDSDRGPIILQALIWIGLVAVWTAVCLIVLRTRSARHAAPSTATAPDREA